MYWWVSCVSGITYIFIGVDYWTQVVPVTSSTDGSTSNTPDFFYLGMIPYYVVIALYFIWMLLIYNGERQLI